MHTFLPSSFSFGPPSLQLSPSFSLTPPSLQGFGWGDTDNCICPPCCYNVSVAMEANKSLELVHKLQVIVAHTHTGIVTV